jgi:WD40 repeat protein
MGSILSKEKIRLIFEHQVASSGVCESADFSALIGLSDTGVWHSAGRQITFEGNHIEADCEISSVLVIKSVLIISMMNGKVVFYFPDGTCWSRSDSVRSLHKEGHWVTSMAHAGEGTVVSVGTDGCLCVWNVDLECGKFSTLLNHTSHSAKAFVDVASLDIGNEGRNVFCVGNDSLLISVKLNSKFDVRNVVRIETHLSGILCVDSTDLLGGLVATGGEDKTVTVWSAEDIFATGNVAHATQTMKHPVNCVKFSPDKQFLAVVAKSEILILRIVADDRTTFILQPVVSKTLSSSSIITSFCWDRDNSKFHACYRVWKIATFTAPKSIHDS